MLNIGLVFLIGAVSCWVLYLILEAVFSAFWAGKSKLLGSAENIAKRFAMKQAQKKLDMAIYNWSKQKNIHEQLEYERIATLEQFSAEQYENDLAEWKLRQVKVVNEVERLNEERHSAWLVNCEMSESTYEKELQTFEQFRQDYENCKIDAIKKYIEHVISVNHFR